jgi:T-complex protein 1 subunit theta
VLAGDLLAQAETLLRMGLHTADVISGFEKAWAKADELLDKMVIHEVKDIKDVAEVARVLKPVIAAKHYGYEDYLAPLVAQACTQILPSNPKNFNVDYVRVAKLLGGGVADSYVLRGMIVQKDAEGTVKQVTNAKVAVFSVGIDVPKTEGKGTLLIKTDKELMEYQRGEDAYMEKLIKGIADAGATVVVSGGTVGDIAMHFLEKYKLMVVKTQSKVELKRLCKATGAAALVRLGIPTPEELGHCDFVGVQEIGSTKVTVFRQDKECPVSTIVVRAATQNVLDDVERALGTVSHTHLVALFPPSSSCSLSLCLCLCLCLCVVFPIRFLFTLHSSLRLFDCLIVAFVSAV